MCALAENGWGVCMWCVCVFFECCCYSFRLNKAISKKCIHGSIIIDLS